MQETTDVNCDEKGASQKNSLLFYKPEDSLVFLFLEKTAWEREREYFKLWGLQS